ncbi:hypothetical protein [Maricaulis sp. CAU 1757]
MPYPRAWLWLLAIIPFIIPAFWRNYFAALDSVPVAFHLHTVSASAWLVLLIAQSWSVHHGRIGLHRMAGKASFVVIPLFIAGGLMVLSTMARAVSPFYDLYASSLGFYDVIAVAGFGVLTWSALRHRRQVQLHSRYMLATVFLLLGPVYVRILNAYVPALQIRGPEDFWLFYWTLMAVQGVLVLATAWLAVRSGRWGRPWWGLCGLLVVQGAAFGWLGRLPAWREMFAAYGTVPTGLLIGLGIGAGVVLVWHAWAAGKRRPKAAAMVAE